MLYFQVHDIFEGIPIMFITKEMRLIPCKHCAYGKSSSCRRYRIIPNNTASCFVPYDLASINKVSDELRLEIKKQEN